MRLSNFWKRIWQSDSATQAVPAAPAPCLPRSYRDLLPPSEPSTPLAFRPTSLGYAPDVVEYYQEFHVADAEAQQVSDFQANRHLGILGLSGPLFGLRA